MPKSARIVVVLPDPIGAEESERLAAIDVKGEIPNNGRAPKIHSEMFDVDKRLSADRIHDSDFSGVRACAGRGYESGSPVWTESDAAPITFGITRA
jgi:hypothetical protein